MSRVVRKRRRDGVVQRYHVLGRGHSADVLDVGRGRVLKKFRGDGVIRDVDAARDIEFLNNYVRLGLHRFKVVVPVKWGDKGLLMPKLRVVVRNASKEEWSKHRNYSIKVGDISRSQVLLLMQGLRDLSNAGISADDYLHVGVDSKGNPYFFDIGGFHKSDRVWRAQDSNSMYWDILVNVLRMSDLKGKLFRKQEPNELLEAGALNKLKYMFSDDVFYTTSRPMSLSEFIELEVKDRQNYSRSEVNVWIRKYGLDGSSRLLWVSPKPYIAARYEMSVEDWDDAERIYNKNKEEFGVLEVKGSDGFIIKESGDGDDGFLFVVKRGDFF